MKGEKDHGYSHVPPLVLINIFLLPPEFMPQIPYGRIFFLVIRKQTLWKRLLVELRLVLSVIASINLEISRNVLDP